MYKIIKDNKVIDVIQTPSFIKFLSTGHIAMTDKSSAQGIVGSDNKTVYSFYYMANKPIDVVTIEEIDTEEFNRLRGLFNSGKEVVDDEVLLETVKNNTIIKVSDTCKAKIMEGFSIILSDGEFYIFRLTIEDKVNLLIIENQLNNGAKTFIYHATNKPCKVFNRDDMIKIIQTFNSCLLYHTTYFNAAKQYIKSLTDIEEVNLFSYGTDISDSVEDIVLKQILKTGGNFT